MEIKYNLDLDTIFDGVIVEVTLNFMDSIIIKCKKNKDVIPDINDLSEEEINSIQIKSIEFPLKRDILFLEGNFVDIDKLLEYVQDCEQNDYVNLMERICDFIDE